MTDTPRTITQLKAFFPDTAQSGPWTPQNLRDFVVSPAPGIQDSNGFTVVSPTAVTSAVNGFNIQGSANGQGLFLSAVGTDTDINIAVGVKGGGHFRIGSPNTSFIHTYDNNPSGTGYNGWSIIADSNGAPAIRPEGIAADITAYFMSKGAGNIAFATGGGTQAVVLHKASAVNYLTVTGGSTGNAPTISVDGSGTDIGVDFKNKGNGGNFRFGNANNTWVNFFDNNASGTNYTGWSIAADSGGSPFIQANGIAADIEAVFRSKGAGNLVLETGDDRQVYVKSTASAVNYLTLTGSSTSTIGGTISADGTGSNLDLKVSPKGTGNLTLNSGYRIRTLDTSISAAGTDSQASSTLLAKEINHVSTAAASSGVRLPAAVAGQVMVVINRGANTMHVYPASGATIDALGANAAFDMSANTTKSFYATSTTQWFSG